MSGRSRRAGRENKQQTALERLKAQREGGKSNKYTVEREDIFEEVDDAEFEKRKNARAGEFVQGEYDDGEEYYEDHELDDVSTSKSKKKTFGQKITSKKGSIMSMMAKQNMGRKGGCLKSNFLYF